jgi:pimeloyl-ACP methyl ester carboxylesterase
MAGTPHSLDYSVLGRTLHVRTSGEGPTVLLVHGLGATSHIWDRFELPGYRLIAVDLPGYGFSEPRNGRQGPRELALLLDALMDQIAPDAPFAVVGHSMGALAALELALAKPARLSAVALLDVPIELPMLARLSSAPLLGEAIFRLPALAPASRIVVRLYLSWLFGDASKVTSKVVDAYSRASGGSHYWSAMLAGLRGISDWAHGERLQGLAVPAVVVWGQEDPILPVAVGRRLAELIPGAEFVPLAGCGHSPAEEAPQALADAVRTLFEHKAGFAPAR